MTETETTQHETRTETAYHAMLGWLQQGDLQPGDLIDRRGVAETLAMSIGPVHQAIALLEREGFVESFPRKATRVRRFTDEDIRGHMVLREAMECQAVYMTHGEPIQAAMDTLLPMAREVDETFGQGPANWDAEVRFHRALVDLAGVPALSAEFARIMRAGYFLKLTRGLPPVQDHERHYHAGLLDLLALKNKNMAMAGIRQHLRSGKRAGRFGLAM